ncbi:MAG: STAS domain-containing protein [Terriglobia bacterium]
MKATLRQVDSITVIDMSGRITLGEGCTQMRELVREQLGKGRKQLLLNLADITYIDSSGIGELVSAFTRVSNDGGQLKLLNLTKKVLTFRLSCAPAAKSDDSTLLSPAPPRAGVCAEGGKDTAGRLADRNVWRILANGYNGDSDQYPDAAFLTAKGS